MSGRVGVGVWVSTVAASLYLYFRLSVGGPVFLRKPACVLMLESVHRCSNELMSFVVKQPNFNDP